MNDQTITDTPLHAYRVSTPPDIDPAAHCHACSARFHAFCGALNDEALIRLSAMTTEMRFRAPQTIIYEDDSAEHAYNLCSGVVRVTKMLPDGRRQITGFLFPGDFMGLTHKDAYGYSVEAVTDVDLCRFPRDRLMSLFEESPEMERKLLAMATDELSSAQEQILLLGRKTARERLASFILKLSRMANGRGEQGDPVALPMSRADIADFLGLTIETVSRTLTKLGKEGLIHLENAHSVRILRKDKLEDVEVGADRDQ
ncbi:MAG: Crp/Fnr family transcriptional regulator [Alphaproteobacteria bacterium]